MVQLLGWVWHFFAQLPGVLCMTLLWVKPLFLEAQSVHDTPAGGGAVQSEVRRRGIWRLRDFSFEFRISIEVSSSSGDFFISKGWITKTDAWMNIVYLIIHMDDLDAESAESNRLFLKSGNAWETRCCICPGEEFDIESYDDDRRRSTPIQHAPVRCFRWNYMWKRK